MPIIHSKDRAQLNPVYPEDPDQYIDNYFGSAAIFLSAGASLYFGIGPADNTYWKPASPTSANLTLHILYYDNGGTLTVGYSADGTTETTVATFDIGDPANTGTWVMASLTLNPFYLSNSYYGDTFDDADFRIYMANGADLYVQAVLVQDNNKTGQLVWPGDASQSAYPMLGANKVDARNLNTTTAPVITGLKWTNNSPGAGSIAWTKFVVTYNGVTYKVAAGNTSSTWCYWTQTTPNSMQTAASLPALAANQFLVALNNSGTAIPSLFTQAIYANYISVATLAAIVANIGTANISDLLTLNGTNGAIAIGNPPPTSSSAGTGVWIDRTGLYVLKAGVVQSKIDASTSLLTAGAGNAQLDVNGVTLIAGTFPATAYVLWKTSGGAKVGDINASVDSTNTQGITAVNAYGPDGTNHIGLLGLAAYDNNAVNSAIINMRSNTELRLILNSGNGQTTGIIPSWYAKDTTGGVTVQNTTVETTIFSTTIKQNALGPNGMLEFDLGCDFRNNISNTITFRVKLGGTTLNTLTRPWPASGTGVGAAIIRAHINNNGSVSAQNAWASLISAIGANDREAADFGTGTINTSTGDNLLIVTAQWTTADTSSAVFSKGGRVLLAYGA